MSSLLDKKDDNKVLGKEVESWKNSFAYALRAKDRELFFEMLDGYKDYVSSAQAKGESFTAESLFMALILEQQKMIKQLITYLSQH